VNHHTSVTVLPVLQNLRQATITWKDTVLAAGIDDMQNKFLPEKVKSFETSKNWAMISIGQHHTVALDANG